MDLNSLKCSEIPVNTPLVLEGDTARNTIPAWMIGGPVVFLTVAPQEFYSTGIGIHPRSGVLERFAVCLRADTQWKPLADPLEAAKFAKGVRTIQEESLERTMLAEGNSVVLINGTDPEMFLEKKDGSLLPAFEFLPSKLTAKKIYDKAMEDPVKRIRGNLVMGYWDGFQAEFEVPATKCMNLQIDQIKNGMKFLLDSARAKSPGAKLSMKTVVPIPLEQLWFAPTEYVALGCAVSENVYGLHGEEVMNPRQLAYRFAGGHKHLGLRNLQPGLAKKITRTLDALVGVPSVTLFQKMDDPIRRKFYGLPGEIRLPKHGLEWRTLSNAWLCHPAITQYVGDLVRAATRLASLDLQNVFKWNEDMVIQTILNHDVDAAKKFVTENRSQYEQIAKSLWPSGVAKKSVWMLQHPVNDFCDPMEVERNWQLDTVWATNADHNTRTWARYAGESL